MPKGLGESVPWPMEKEVTHMGVQWPEEHKDRFLILDQDGEQHAVSGYGLASVSDIVTLVRENALADSIGEDKPHRFRLWRLTPIGPTLATITTRTLMIPEFPSVEVILTWRVPVEGNKFETVSESGFYRMSGV